MDNNIKLKINFAANIPLEQRLIIADVARDRMIGRSFQSKKEAYKVLQAIVEEYSTYQTALGGKAK